MRKLTVTLCLTLAVILGSVRESFAGSVWTPIKGNPECYVHNNDPHLEEVAIWSGSCVNGKVHGKGVLRWKYKKDKLKKYEVVEGTWQNGKLEGKGAVTFASGNKYVGEHRDDKRHGHGTFTSTNGDKYVGKYRDHKRHGQGTYTFANGDKYVVDGRMAKGRDREPIPLPMAECWKAPGRMESSNMPRKSLQL